jgi:acetyl esterase/lipase
MKTKILLTALALIISLQFTQAQYLVSATHMYTISASDVLNYLNNQGYDTSSMTLNAVISYTITYNTTDVFGNPTIASGALYVPQLGDLLPLVSYQHGTEFNKSEVPSNGYYWVPGLLYSGNGYITTLPDYLGMGVNPGIHPYVHWESEATASIDLMRAAREYLLDTLQILDNNQLFLTGYSQGGHSTMALHKYITDNNLENEFNVVASAPMSGPYDLSSTTLDFLFGSPTYPRPEFVPYLGASYQYIYGNLYTSYDEYYDPPYDTIIADWIAAGTNPPFGTEPPFLPENFYEFMQDSVVDNIKNNPNHPLRVDLSYNDLYNWIPQEPVRMLYCTNDHLVPFENSILARDTMNALGAPDVQAIDVYPNGNHYTCGIPAQTYSLDWFNSYVLSINEQSIEGLKLYPNPTNSILNIEAFTPITSIEIFTVLGQKILEQSVSNNKVQVDFSGFSRGNYFVRVTVNHNTNVLQVIKQ